MAVAEAKTVETAEAIGAAGATDQGVVAKAAVAGVAVMPLPLRRYRPRLRPRRHQPAGQTSAALAERAVDAAATAVSLARPGAAAAAR